MYGVQTLLSLILACEKYINTLQNFVSHPCDMTSLHDTENSDRIKYEKALSINVLFIAIDVIQKSFEKLMFICVSQEVLHIPL